MMNQDYEMWNIEQLLESYVDVPELAGNVKTKLEALFLFLEANSLLKSRVSDGNGRVVKRSIRKSELTDEGLRLSSGPKNPVHRWLASKPAQKNPPDMKMLEKALGEIRG